MSEENVKIVLSAEDRASAIVQGFTREISRLQNLVKGLKLNPMQGSGLDQGGKIRADITKTEAEAMRGLNRRFSFETRMSRQRTAEARNLSAQEERQDRARKAADDAAMRRLRDQFSFQGRMLRQQAAMERDAERARAAGIRNTARIERDLARDHARYISSLRSTGSRAASSGRDLGRDLIRYPAAAGAAAGAVGIGASRKAMRAESAIDASEINSRIYGDLSADAARKLRDGWAAPLAESLGTGTDKMLSSYTEALKLGIPKAGASQFAELATKTSEAWSVEFGAVVDILGTTNSILTSDGSPFDFDKLKSVANTLQYLAAKQSTTPEKLMSFLQRGAGAAKVLGMSQEAGLAFGSASTSLGNQAGQSGRLFDYMASRVIELPKLTRGHGEQARDARRLVQQLGYGSADALDRSRRKDPDAFLPEFIERFKRIKDPKQRDQAIRFFAGREWLGEFGRMVTGFETYREAAKLSKEAKGLDAISQVWDLHKLKLSFIMKQFNAGFNNILGEAGKAFTPLAREVGDYFLQWSGAFRKDEGLAKRVSASLQGMIEGFGFKDIKAMLTGILGNPGESNLGSMESWKATAKAFTSGISDVVGSLKSIAMTAAGGDPETLARWTGRILSFTAAMVLLSPVIGVLSRLVSFVWAIGRAAVSLSGGLGGLGARAGGAALFGAGALATMGSTIALGFLATIAEKFKVLQFQGLAEEFVPAPLRRLMDWWNEKPADKGDGSGTGKGGAGTGSPGIRAPDGTPGSRQSLDVETTGSIASMIKKASYTGYDDSEDAPRRMTNAVEDLRGLIQKAALTPGAGLSAGSMSSGGGGGGGGGGGSAGGGSGKFFTPEGMQVPGFYGRSRGAPGSTPSSPGYMGGSTAPRGSAAKNFASLAPKIMGDLQKDFGLSKVDAAAVLGNLGHESAGMTAYQEGNPRGGGRGGAGWAQWTGPRRRQFEAYAAANGLDPKSYEANYGFLKHELSGAYKGSLNAVRGANGLENKTVAFEGSFEKAGVKHYGSRIGYARQAMGLDGNSVAGLGGGTGQYDGLRVKGGQAIGGGDTALGLTDLARQAQMDLPGGVKHFGAFNDHYHKGTGSKHASGLAFDTTLNDPKLSAQAAEAMRSKMRAAGLDDSQFKVIDEYLNPSSRSTGGHIHTQFNDQAAAKQYHQFVESMGGKAVASVKAIGQQAKAAEAVKMPGGAKPGAVNADGITGVPFGAKPTTDQIVSSVPVGVNGRGAGGAPGGGGGAGGNTYHNHIHGAGENPEAIAQKAQRAFEKSSRHSAYFPEAV